MPHYRAVNVSQATHDMLRRLSEATGLKMYFMVEQALDDYFRKLAQAKEHPAPHESSEQAQS